ERLDEAIVAAETRERQERHDAANALAAKAVALGAELVEQANAHLRAAADLVDEIEAIEKLVELQNQRNKAEGDARGYSSPIVRANARASVPAHMTLAAIPFDFAIPEIGRQLDAWPRWSRKAAEFRAAAIA